ncbi:hypothetical protein KVR01_012945 [Diaporthe batatas]|uniref:uncharacterized protein n=1 Tax=Diaporthe batatas TaxID=748121 RepID=UPI001D0543C0|nr:uncharacterized protein KVR01_012945 [Diaporthe batatas]KAG8157237.1 hypothetical protein KVR01_012945 [Diaporthe batatas]
MDTPGPGVVKDSQEPDPEQLLPLYTPKSAGFGSPIATQESYTNPRRSQVRQIAKASFLDDDDDNTGQGAEEQYSNDVNADPQDPFDDRKQFDSTASEPDLALDGESNCSFNIDSPTPRASQAAHMPPQSAQPIPIPRSSRPDSTDPFGLFEELKKPPPAAVASKKPSHLKQTQKPGSAGQGTTPARAKREATTKETASKPKVAARKALAVNKAKLPALELEGDTETASPVDRKPQEHDYSLPASNSSSPATSPAKKKPAPRSSAAKKAEPKANARAAKKDSKAPVKQGKRPSADRAKQAKAAPDPSFNMNSEVQTDAPEDECENNEHEHEPSGLNPGPHEAGLRETVSPRAHKPSSPVNEEGQDHITISSESISSFPESDNTDDEDFECTRKMTPANARRRTRAAVAQSQARKEAAAKVEDKSAPVSNSQRPQAKDESHQRNPRVQSRAQSKKSTTKAAAGKSNGAAAPVKSTSEPTEETEPTKTMSAKTWPSDKQPEEMISTAKQTAAANEINKDKGHVRRDAAVPPKARSTGKGKTNEVVQASAPAKLTGTLVRNPNTVAIGHDDPKNNGKSLKTTTTVDLRSEDQRLGPSKGGQSAPSKTRTAKESQNAPRMRLKTTVESEGSPSENCEIGQSRSSRNTQPNGGQVIPDRATPEADKNTSVVHSDAETTEPNYEAEWADATDTFVPGDAEDDTVVEDAMNAVAHSYGRQKHGAAHDFDGTWGREVLEPLPEKIKYPQIGEHRTMLGEVDPNIRSLPKDAPNDLPHLTKRKFPVLTTAPKVSADQQPLMSKTEFQYRDFPTLRKSSAGVPSESEGPPMKKARYISARPVRVHGDANHDRHPFGGLNSLNRGADNESRDDIFGSIRKGKLFAASAFTQRLINSESADHDAGQVGPVAQAASGRAAVPRQSAAPFYHASEARSGAPEVMSTPVGNQKMDDMGKRMRAALESEDERAPNPLASGDERGKSFAHGEVQGPWPNDAFEQSKTSELEERTRAWKKATEPYAETLGETMHKIVNTILRGLKATESSIDDVVEDYRNDGQRVVERIAEKHRKEKVLVIQQQEQERLRRLQAYGQAQQVTERVLGQLESVDLDTIMVDMAKDSPANRLQQLKQRIRDV